MNENDDGIMDLYSIRNVKCVRHYFYILKCKYVAFFQIKFYLFNCQHFVYYLIKNRITFNVTLRIKRKFVKFYEFAIKCFLKVKNPKVH